MERAIFAAGCFWGVQYYFDQVPGVISTIAGYTGGHTVNPTYEAVCTHKTGHAEAVQIDFDPKVVDYKTLLKHLFRMHDPTQLNRQGPDIGDSYRSAIFYLNDTQHDQVKAAIKTAQEALSSPIVTEVTKAKVFYGAEDYHQKFAERTGRGICHTPYEQID